MSEDWYRSTRWDPQIRDAFMAKLARARSQRQQYIAIQALTLAETAPQGTLELVELYHQGQTDELDVQRVALAKARALTALGQLRKAAEAYRDLIAEEANSQTFKVGAGLDYAVFVVEHGLTDLYPGIADSFAGDPPDAIFVMVAFRWHAVRAVLSAFSGAAEDARDHAQTALALAKRTRSDLPRHPTVGLVEDGGGAMRARLETIVATGKDEGAPCTA